MKHLISLEQAVKMTTAFRAVREKLLAGSTEQKIDIPLSETVDRAAVDAVLAQKGCTQLRIYWGLNERGELSAVMVGVDEAGNDLLTPDKPEECIIVEEFGRCPPTCPQPSPLNTLA